MKTLLIGASGQVGAELLAAARPEDGLVATTRSGALDGRSPSVALDVGDLAILRRTIRDIAPDVMINATAYTAVDRAEQARDDAFRVNADAVAVMADECRRLGARFVHYSTDYVFDGTADTPYSERSATSPLGVYGESKLDGEQAIEAAGGDHLILRTAWVYAPHGHNFVRTMLRLGRERDELRVVDDQIGCPTPASWIAATTFALLRSREHPTGIVNVVAAGQTSWFGFAEAIFHGAERLGLIDRAPTLVPIATHEFPTPAKRPAYSVLDTARLRSLGVSPPEWRDALQGELARIQPVAGAPR